MATWIDSEDDSIEEENENKVANMCFIAIEEQDEVNSNSSNEDLQKDFMETLKNVPLKKKKKKSYVLKMNLRIDKVEKKRLLLKKKVEYYRRKTIGSPLLSKDFLVDKKTFKWFLLAKNSFLIKIKNIKNKKRPGYKPFKNKIK